MEWDFVGVGIAGNVYNWLSFGISSLHLYLSLHFIYLSFHASQNNTKSADKLSDGRNRNHKGAGAAPNDRGAVINNRNFIKEDEIMAISGIGSNYNNVYGSTYTAQKNETVKKTGELSEAEEMELFKKEFYAEIDKIPKDRTIANVAINISEEAFKNMKADPKYREQMLSVIRRDMTGSVAPAPDCSMVITVGATAKDYRADSWSVNNDSEFYARSQNSFYKKTSVKKDRQKELLEEYLEKRAQVKRQQQEMLNEKIAKQEQERSRLAKAWSSKQQMSVVSNAYDANVMMETVAHRKGRA